MVESKESAVAYLKEKNIGQVFAELSTSLLYNKPADPRAHLIQELEKMQRRAPPSFFGEEDLRAMFATLDPTNVGTISAAQVRTSMENLGLTSIPDDLPETVGIGEFVRIARAAIQTDRIL